MAVNTDKLIEDLYGAAETPEEREQLKTLLSKPTVKQRLAKPLEEAEESVRKTIDDTRRWRDGEQQKVNDFYAKYGDPEKLRETHNPNVLRGETGQFISRADLDKFLADRDTKFEERLMQHSQTAVAIAKDLVTVSHLWSKEFDEPLPLEEVEKVAATNGVSVAIAADMVARPKREAKQQENFQKQIDAAREEGRQAGYTAARSESNVDSRFIDGHAIFGKRDVSDVNPTTGKKMTEEEYEEASMKQFEQSYNKIMTPQSQTGTP